MPYRALLWTMVTVALALLLVALWVRAIEPLVSGAQKVAATRPVATMRFGKPVIPPEVELTVMAKLTLVLGFFVVGLLLIVGMFGAFREWMRFRGDVRRGAGRRGRRTQYVDAWKIAGERLKPGAKDEPEDS